MASSQHTQRRPRRRIASWVLLALLIHVEVLVGIGLFTFFWAPRQAELEALSAAGKNVPESIDISTLDEETSRKLVAEMEKEEEKRQEEEKKKEEEKKEAPGQVVDLAKPREEQRPDQAKFAAEYDVSVAKETKKYGKFDQRARQGDQQGDSAESRPATPPAQPKTAPPTPPGMMAMRNPGPEGKKAPPGAVGMVAPTPSGLPGESLEAPLDDKGELARKGTGQQPTTRSPPGGASGGPQAPNVTGAPAPLLPSEQQLARAIGSGSQDHLKDIDDGAETALNAKKWKFASFFNRVKQQVRDHWSPADEYRRRDPSGAIYGSKDRYTLLRVALKPDGTLASVALETPSGVEFLDDEAIEAFKQAQPFPNPPKQLVEQDGTITFRFGFFFELSGSPRMKIFKYGSM